MSANGSVEVYLGATEPYVGDYDSTETYELHSISYSCNAEGVAVAMYNTPDNLNCLSPSLTAETFLVLEHAARDDACKVLIWTGSGDRAFSSGAALKGDGEHFTVHVPPHVVDDYEKRKMTNQPPSIRPPDMVMARQTIAFWDFPKPLIMAVNGLAVGGGANIALANYADMVICSTSARFKYPFSTLGLTPELGSSSLIPFVVGMAKAKEIMMIGDWFSAEDAVELGLANEVVDPEDLMSRALEIATELTTRKGAALSLAKKIMNHHLRKDLDEVLATELEVIMESVKVTGGFDNAKL